MGGLSSGQAAIILRDLAGINILGGDVVEVSPQYDSSGATAVAGAHVAVELICLWAHRHKRNGRSDVSFEIGFGRLWRFFGFGTAMDTVCTNL